MREKVNTILTALFVFLGMILTLYLSRTSLPQKAMAKNAFIKEELIRRGEYLVKIQGCNDCHTPNFLTGANLDSRQDWLIGSQVGWYGPWGTTYAPNLRSFVRSFNDEQWVSYVKNLNSRPPMPSLSLKQMDERDILALKYFISSLGFKDNKVPVALPPGKNPNGDYIDMSLKKAH